MRYNVARGDEQRLQQLARQRLRAGAIPARQPDQSWGGRGSRQPCPVCGRAVSAQELEMELEFRSRGGVERFFLHIQCYGAWDIERRQMPPESLPAANAGGIISPREGEQLARGEGG